MINNFNKNIIWSLISQFSNFGLSLIITIFLARIILPQEYGLVDLALTVTAFFMIFADGGIVWSIVREKFIKNEEVVNLFWINTLLGLSLTLLCFFSSNYISEFYNQPELNSILEWFSLIFLITGISTPYQMWIKRKMEFKKLTLIQFFSTFIGGGLALYFAYNNYGYWTLIILNLSKASLLLIFLFFFTDMPKGFYKLNIKIKHLIKFGLGLMGFSIVNYLARNLDNVLIGKYLGIEELAFYAKAYFLMFLPSTLSTGALSGLMISILSKYQDDNKKFQLIYSKMLRAIFLITLPLTGYFLIFPQDPINLLYGPNWTGSILLLQLLGIATITQPLYNTMGWTYTAVGKSKEMFKWGLFSSALLSVSFIIGIQWGAEGIAMSYSITMGLFIFIYGLIKAHEISNISFTKTFKMLIPVCIIGIISLSIIKSLDLFYFNFDSSLVSIFIKILLLLSLYIGLLYLYYRKKLIEIIDFRKIGN